jgi:hypothetical protein
MDTPPVIFRRKPHFLSQPLTGTVTKLASVCVLTPKGIIA